MFAPNHDEHLDNFDDKKPTRSFKISRSISESLVTNFTSIDFEYELGHGFKPIQEDMLTEMIQLLVAKGQESFFNLKFCIINRMIFFNLTDVDLNALAVLNKPLKIEYGYNLKTLTPLMAAVISNNVVAVKELVQAGCDCNFQDESSRISALHLACRLPKNEIASIIIKRGNVDLSLTSKNGDTCLHWLAKSDKDDSVVFQLIMTSMSYALEKKVEQGEEDKIYINLRNFINQTNNEDQTALMIAAKNNHQNLVKFLLDYNASIDLVDKNGLKAIQHAKLNSCAQLITSYAKVALLTSKKSLQYTNRPDSETLSKA